jgi:hypothetical protein
MVMFAQQPAKRQFGAFVLAIVINLIFGRHLER